MAKAQQRLSESLCLKMLETVAPIMMGMGPCSMLRFAALGCTMVAGMGRLTARNTGNGSRGG